MKLWKHGWKQQYSWTHLKTCQYRYHKLLERSWIGRSFEISPWSPRMGSRRSAASASPTSSPIKHGKYASWLSLKRKYPFYQHNRKVCLEFFLKESVMKSELVADTNPEKIPSELQPDLQNSRKILLHRDKFENPPPPWSCTSLHLKLHLNLPPP